MKTKQIQPYKGIAFAGKAGSGKNFYARRVCQVMETCDLAPVLLSFAEPLKREAELVTGMSPDDRWFRDQVLRFGDEMRASDPNIYVDQMQSRLIRATASGQIPIVTDLRLRNERALCKSHGLLLVRVNAPYVERLAALRERGDESEILDSIHPTETELDDAEFDLVIVNLWDPMETFRTVTQIVTVWQGETEVVA